MTLYSDSTESLAGPWGLAFDSAGDLWVADDIGNHIVEFTPGQLTTGTPVPADQITSDQLDQPKGIAFDHKGNLWVADAGGTLIEFFPKLTPGTASHIMGAHSGLSGHGFLAVAPTTSTPNSTWDQRGPPQLGRPTVVTVGHASVTVSWRPPATGPGGSPITRYFVTAVPYGAECEWVSGPLDCTVPMPNNPNWTACFVVQAQNAYGTSLISNSSPVVSSLPVGPTTPAPTITSISPDAGSTDGGTRVWITGSNLTSVHSVGFGTLVDAPDLTLFGVVNSTTMWADTPGATPGTVNVAVTGLNGTSESSAASAYHYR